MTGRIFIKLIVGVICVLAVALIAADILASRLVQESYHDTLTRELTARAYAIALSLDRIPQAEDLARRTGARLTVIARDGRVLADNEADPRTMENHGSRPEVAAALQGNVRSATRISTTVGQSFLYVAVPAAPGAVRLAVPLGRVEEEVRSIRNQLLAAVSFSFFPAVLLAAYLARRLSARLARIIEYAGRLASGDFRARLPLRSRDELGVLEAKLNETSGKLERAVQELASEHEQLERLEQVRKDFVINVSHELRTPLASIQGYTETLLEGALHDPEHNVQFLSIIRQNAERLGRLTGDLMTLSHLELRQTRFESSFYLVNDLLAEALASMAPIATKKNVALVSLPIAGDARVWCDSEAVQQVLVNLLDNAVKYTPPGGSVYVGAHPAPGDPDRMELYVRDTGQGIPAADVPRLFERFYRVDKGRSRELGGTGLGLAIVKHLTRAQGGSVRVESELGQGSTFFFTLATRDLGETGGSVVQPELTAL